MQVRITILYLVTVYKCVGNTIVTQDYSPINWTKCGSGDACKALSIGFTRKDLIHWGTIVYNISTPLSHTHPNSNIDVVGVDLSPQVLADPLLAKELFEKLGAIFQVVTADPPLPRLSMLDTGWFVARAPLHAPWAACFGKCMGQCGRGHCQ